MVYKWKSGARIKISAQVAGERIDGLRSELGRALTRSDVLEDARNLKSPLHAAFEWDDGLAAEQHRLAQASHLLNCLVCTSIKVKHPNENRPRTITNVRAYHSVVRDDERGYETTARIMSNTDLREQLLQSAADDLQRFKNKYKKLRELAAVFTAIQAFRKVLRMPKKKKPTSTKRLKKAA